MPTDRADAMSEGFTDKAAEVNDKEPVVASLLGMDAKTAREIGVRIRSLRRTGRGS